MYLPTMETRHGDAAAIVSQREARQLFRRGCLFLVKREGQTVAGCLCHIQRHKVRFIYLGVAHGDKQLVEEGVIGAMNILRLRWANEVGYQAVDLLGCPPYFRMGVFQYKRKWGTTVSLPPKSHKLIWMRFQHDTPAVRQFIKDNPCIIIDENGDLQGLVAVDDTSSITSQVQEQLHKQYYTPGLKGLLIRSVTDLVGRPDGRSALSTKNLVRPEQEERSPC
jgi:hypothetical protein